MAGERISFFFLGSLVLFGVVVGNDIDVNFEDNYKFTVSIGNEEWFRSGGLQVRHQNQLWSSDNKAGYHLKLASPPAKEEGNDPIGFFNKLLFTWDGYVDSTRTGLRIVTAVAMYTDVPVVVFDIVYITGLSNAATSDGTSTLSTFPSFVAASIEIERGWMTWSGNMATSMKFGLWSQGDDNVYSAMDGGFPLVFFDSTMTNAVVLSPLNSFMSATQTSFTNNMTKEEALTLGPLGSINDVPALYMFRSVMVAGGNVTDAMMRFGEVLRTLYRKDDSFRKSDFSINYLGYWTDNGACYYYYTGNYSNYEDVLVAVKKAGDKAMIPYRYVQLDSWWYYKGKGGGVKNWTAQTDVFPNGIEAVVEKTGWPIVGHNRWWSNETDYAKQFNFIFGKEAALPMDPEFWDYLISTSKKSWDLIVYEQDWLDSEVVKVDALKTELGLGEKWLNNMGMSAQRYGITVQYCMPWPRHVLQSVMIPAVTQIRVSHDYNPDNEQWKVGDTTILSHAVGLAAFKDDFRTSTNEPNCKKYLWKEERYPMLEAYAAALTGGPVGPSDMIGTEDTTLIMATCMKDGRLLKPTRPAMSLDSTFLQRAFDAAGPERQLTAAFTEIGQMTWYYVMGAEVEAEYALKAADLPPSRHTFPASSMDSVIFQYDIQTMKVSGIQKFTDNSITIGISQKKNFQYFVIAPKLPNGMFLFGELNKFVTVSETRITHIDVTGEFVYAEVMGVPGEEVKMTLYDGQNIMTVDCLMGDSGYADLEISTVGSGCNPI